MPTSILESAVTIRTFSLEHSTAVSFHDTRRASGGAEGSLLTLQIGTDRRHGSNDDNKTYETNRQSESGREKTATNSEIAWCCCLPVRGVGAKPGRFLELSARASTAMCLPTNAKLFTARHTRNFKTHKSRSQHGEADGCDDCSSQLYEVRVFDLYDSSRVEHNAGM